VERALAAAGSAALPEPEAEALRIEAGRPAFGRDIGPENLPDEAGLADAISATKGCYVGQEIVARRRTYGRMNRRLVGYRFPDGLVAPDAVLSRPDVPPERDRTEAGRVTSAAVSSRFGPIGLGFAFHDVPLGARLVTREAPRRAAVVSPLPFA
jgi:folate-binding protein YgfZ